MKSSITRTCAVLFVAFVCFGFAPPKSQLKSFLGVRYDRVLAYSFESNPEGSPPVIDSKGQPTKYVKKYMALAQSDIDYLDKILSSPKTYGEAPASCFEPALALVYFKNNKPVIQIDICFECNHLYSTVPIKASRIKWVHDDNGKRIYPLDGFSKKGGDALYAFFKKLRYVK